MFEGIPLFTERSGEKLKSMMTRRFDEPRFGTVCSGEQMRGLLSGLTEKGAAIAPKDNSVLM